jgi:prephenate dehydrogenase
MTVQVTIIGMGQVGTSIGLALEPQKERILRVGHDRYGESTRQAEKMGAVDKIIGNIHAAVENADIVILAIHEDRIRNTLELIAPDLKEGSVVMDTSTSMVTVGNWVKELLPEDRYFATISPSVNPQYMESLQAGPEAAHADLFKKSVLVINSPAGMPADAIRLATELAGLLGATPFYADPHEFDGLIASSKVLPQLMAVALVNSTVEKPGWREGRKLAGKYYNHITETMMYLPEGTALESMAMMNRENVTRVINDLIYSLIDLRDAVADEDREKLEKLVSSARQGQANWFNQRMAAEWEKESQRADVPSTGENLARFFTGGLFKKRDDKKK